MNPNNNQRCGCPCRPQIPAPPCMNTDCGCGRCSNMPMPPSPCMPPQQPACNMAPPTVHLHVACQDSAPQPMPAKASSAGVGSASQQIPGNSGNSLSGQQTFPPAMQPSSAPGHSHNPASVTSCGCGSGNPIVPDADLGRMPIGMGYVPWQTWGQTYPMEQGFVRGTLFPDLDLPFLMGRCR